MTLILGGDVRSQMKYAGAASIARRHTRRQQYVVHKGDTVSLGTPGGGHNDPRLRDPAALAADIAAGYVTNAKAYAGN